MTEGFTNKTIEEHRPTYSDGSKTQLSTAEFVVYRALQVVAVVLCSPFIIFAIVLVLLIDGVPSYTELKNGVAEVAISFATDRSPPQGMCDHEWEFTTGDRERADPVGLRADGLHYRVYDNLRYECSHCGKFEWVHANETSHTIEPVGETE